MEPQPLTSENVAQALHAALPEFYDHSDYLREYLADPENNWIYSVIWDYGRRITDLINERNEADLTRYFNFLNEMITTEDLYLYDCILECVLERLALIKKEYYEEGLKRLSPRGIQLLELCKANPPLGEVPPPW